MKAQATPSTLDSSDQDGDGFGRGDARFDRVAWIECPASGTRHDCDADNPNVNFRE